MTMGIVKNIGADDQAFGLEHHHLLFLHHLQFRLQERMNRDNQLGAGLLLFEMYVSTVILIPLHTDQIALSLPRIERQEEQTFHLERSLLKEKIAFLVRPAG